MTSNRQDFLGQYKAISAKLKRRFLRKPNVSEASIKFGDLAKQLELDECSHYAAFCCLAVARCENTLGNFAEESQALVRAARLFLESEELNHELSCPSYSENLNGALSCYSHAIKVYLEQNQVALACSLCLESGNALRHLGKMSEAISHYQRAASLQGHCTLDYVKTIELIAGCKMKIGDFEGALHALTVICDIAEEKGCEQDEQYSGVYASLLGSAEITKVLLLLLLKPTGQKLVPSNVKTLAKYTSESLENNNSGSYLNEALFILMQSLVMACQSNETESIRILQNDLWPHLTAEQNDLLHRLISKIEC